VRKAIYRLSLMLDSWEANYEPPYALPGKIEEAIRADPQDALATLGLIERRTAELRAAIQQYMEQE
jgi:hypothetical protein